MKKRRQYALTVEMVVFHSENNETWQFSKDASEIYKRIKTDPEQVLEYPERISKLKIQLKVENKLIFLVTMFC